MKGTFSSDHPPFVKVEFGNWVSDQNGSEYILRVYQIDEGDKAQYPTSKLLRWVFTLTFREPWQ